MEIEDRLLDYQRHLEQYLQRADNLTQIQTLLDSSSPRFNMDLDEMRKHSQISESLVNDLF